MSALLAALAIGAAFVMGFLLGDRRGVKQANAILADCQTELFKAIHEDKTGFPSDAAKEDARPTVH
jgi:hypothetical protein